MKLWHRTDRQGKDAIQSAGFAQADPPIGPAWDSPERGGAWFANSKEIARQTCWRSGWWVWIDAPEGTLEHVLSDGSVFSGNYFLEIDYVNGLTMTFEEGE